MDPGTAKMPGGIACLVLGSGYGYLLGKFRYEPKTIHAIDLNRDGTEDVIVKSGANVRYGFIRTPEGRYRSVDDIRKEESREKESSHKDLQGIVNSATLG